MTEKFVHTEVLPPEPPDDSWHDTARYRGEPSRAKETVVPVNKTEGTSSSPETIRGIHSPTARGLRTPTMRGVQPATRVESALSQEKPSAVPDKIKEIEAKTHVVRQEMKGMATEWSEALEALQWDAKDVKALAKKAEIESRLSEIAKEFLTTGEMRQELDMDAHDEFARFCRESGLDDQGLIEEAVISAGVDLTFPSKRDGSS